jgi:hypothetical protein
MLESGALDHSAILTTEGFSGNPRKVFQILYRSVNGVITNRLLFPKYLHIIIDYKTTIEYKFTHIDI